MNANDGILFVYEKQEGKPDKFTVVTGTMKDLIKNRDNCHVEGWSAVVMTQNALQKIIPSHCWNDQRKIFT